MVLAPGRCLEHVAGRGRKGLGEAVETKQVNLALPALEKSSYSWSDSLCRESQRYSALLAARRPALQGQGCAQARRASQGWGCFLQSHSPAGAEAAHADSLG